MPPPDPFISGKSPTSADSFSIAWPKDPLDVVAPPPKHKESLLLMDVEVACFIIGPFVVVVGKLGFLFFVGGLILGILLVAVG